eukprot:3430501-Amphidinium_carterae.1
MRHKGVVVNMKSGNQPAHQMGTLDEKLEHVLSYSRTKRTHLGSFGFCFLLLDRLGWIPQLGVASVMSDTLLGTKRITS